MRIIGILLVLLVLAYLYKSQIDPDRADDRAQQQGLELDANAPALPTRPGEVDKFGKDMKEYLDEQAKKRADAIDDAQDD